jgi:hypothetical protein
MMRLLCVAGTLLAVAAAALGGRPDTVRTDSDADTLAAAIDHRIADKLRAAGVAPAPPADDASFFRRINLSLAGRIPVPSEVRAFLADTDPAKRRKAVDRLLISAAYANHLTTVWRGWLLPEARTAPDVANAVPAFEAWLRPRVRADVPYDRLVTELLTAPLDGRRSAGQEMPDDDPAGANGPVAFYTAKDGKPENLAAATSRVFLGVRLECAQCHDHPFARWSRDQFWGLAAFYGGIGGSGGNLREVFDRRELAVPNRDRAVPATFLDGKEPEWQFRKSPRVTLAAWLTAPDNPFFARAAVNRYWGLLFGVGLVDPVDDFHEKNPPSHPELLDDLAQAFVASGFDTKFLLRAICRSETFGRSSAITEPGQGDVRLLARFPVQGLTPEQLVDSLQVLTGAGPRPSGPGAGAGLPRLRLLETFALSGTNTETQTTILQALSLMNGSVVGAATTPATSRVLEGITELPGLTNAERVEALYLAALSRQPSDRELTRALHHVESAGESNTRAGYADVLWALLNGVEFRTNH